MASNGDDVAAAGGSSVLDFTANDILANSANAKSKRAASRAAILDYVLTNQLMDKQNEYNKPINQMARLREAGLNPNLVYGDGGATMASASGSVNVGASDVTPATGSLGVLSKMQIINAMKQQDANIAETEARTEAIDDNMQLKREELEERKRFNNAHLKLMEEQINRYGVQNQKAQEEIEYLRNKFDWRNPNDVKKIPEILKNLYEAFS